MHWQLGTVSEGLGALAGFAAVAWAIVTTRNERRNADERSRAERALTQEALAQGREAIELERQRWQEELTTRERAQAALVSVVAQPPKQLAIDDDTEVRLYQSFEVTNSSAAGIHEVRAFVVFQGVLRRTPARERYLFVSPADASTVTVTLSTDSAVTPPPDSCGITFRDNAGVYWARFASGDLLRLVRNHDEEIRLFTNRS